MANMEIKKMKQGMSYSCKEKTIILNVFKYFRHQFPEKCVTDLVRRTAKATGCSEKSIFQFRKEEASVEGFREPSKTKIRKNININSRDIKYDNNVRQSIRNIIYDLRYRKIVPSLNTILKQVNADNQLPNFSLMTLRRLMFDMGFYYEKSGNKSILAEKSIINKDNVPLKRSKEDAQVESNERKSMFHSVPQQNLYNIPPPPPPPQPMTAHHIAHHQHMNQQHPQRIVPMHMSMQEAHMMPSVHAPTPHSMPMMLNNCRDLLPPNHAMGPPNMMDINVKREVSSWIHSHNMNK